MKKQLLVFTAFFCFILSSQKVLAQAPATTYYADFDNDGYGDLSKDSLSLIHPSGYVTNSLDCNDQDYNIKPYVIEKCNTIDDDCDGLVDDSIIRPKIFTNKPPIICEGESIVLESSLPSNNHWNTNSNSFLISVTLSGTYIVTNQLTMCQSLPLEVTVNPRSATPVISSDPNISLCSGNYTVLKPSPAFKYIWSNGASTDSLIVSQTGQYSLKVLDTGSTCPSFSSGVITVTVNPVPAPPVITCAQTTICENSAAFIQGNFSPSANVVWSNGTYGTSITVGAGNYFATAFGLGGCLSSSSNIITIVEKPLLPKPIITPLNPLAICSGKTATLESSPAFGYFWNTGERTRRITTSGAGSFFVFTNDGICSSVSPSDTVKTTQVFNTDIPVITADGDLRLCKNDTLRLTSTAATSYLWNNGETTQSIIVTKSGNYNVTAFNNNDCGKISDNIFVDDFHRPVINNLGSFSFCAGDSVKLTSYLTYGIDKSYLWSNGDTMNSVVIHDSQTLTVQITDDKGCLSAVSNPITVTSSLSSSPPTIFTNNVLDACLNDPIILVSSSSTGNLWSDGSTAQTFHSFSPGTFSLTVNNPAQCISGTSAPFTVVRSSRIASLTAQGSTTICEGEKVVLTSGSPVGNLWSTGETTQSISVSKYGSYNVRYTDSLGCETNESNYITVVVDLKPETPVISSFNGFSACEGDTIYLYNFASGNRLWSNGETTGLIKITTSGSYSLTRIDNASGCVSEPSLPVTITINSHPAKPIISILGNSSICNGESVLINSSPSFGYSWNTGFHTKGIAVLSTGDYFVNAVDSNGCKTASDTVHINVNALPQTPVITASKIPVICAGDSVILSTDAAAGYIWNNGATTQHMPAHYGAYYKVSVIDSNGCKSYESEPFGVIVNNGIKAPSILPVYGSNNLCEGDSVTLSSFLPLHNLWSTGDTTQTLVIKQGGDYTLTAYDSSSCVSGTSSIFSVFAHPRPSPPILTANGSSSFCNGGAVFLISSYDYSGGKNVWSDGVISSFPGRTIDHSVELSVSARENNFGCTSLTSNIINVYEAPPLQTPTITRSGTINFCLGDSVILTSSFPHNNAWTNGISLSGDTTQSITVKTTGDYSVHQVDSIGCSSQNAITFPVKASVKPTKPLITSSEKLIYCMGEPINLVLTSSSDSNNVWNTGDFISMYQKTKDVIYPSFHYVRVYNNDCFSQSDTVFIQQRFPPATPEITVTGSQYICSDDSVAFISNHEFGNLWSTGDITQSITIDSSEIENGSAAFTLHYTDEFGCSPVYDASTYASVISVDKPELIAVGSSRLCSGDSVQIAVVNFGGEGTTFLWNTGQTTSDIYITTPGSYFVQVFTPEGCHTEFSDPFVIDTIIQKTLPVITASGPTEYCVNQPVNLFLSSNAPGYNYWNTGYSNLYIDTIQIISPSIVKVTAYDREQCIYGESTIQIISHPLPDVPVISSNGPAAFCNGGSVTLTSNFTNGNLWSTGDTTRSITLDSTNLVTGVSTNITLQSSNEFGCKSSYNANINVLEYSIPDAPDVYISGHTTICNGHTTFLGTNDIAFAFLWSNGETTANITINTAGSYSLQKIFSNGCISAPSIPFIITMVPTLKLFYDYDGDNFGTTSGTITSCTVVAGYSIDSTDCNDFNANVHAVATYYIDNDHDDFGSLTIAQLCAAIAPYGYSINNSDCDDNNSGVNPIAGEICNAVDDDCDNSIDENVAFTFYTDADGDSYGDINHPLMLCSAQAGYVSNSIDCDDIDAAINPSATEVCNLLDDNCDNIVDENAGFTFYADSDGDSYGDINNIRILCSAQAGFVSNSDDCNDNDAAINPLASEICNLLDDDCDNAVDENAGLVFYADSDGDTYGDLNNPHVFCSVQLGYVSNSTDCNDNNAAIHPSATEVCNTLDDDCDGLTDEEVGLVFYADSDNDSYGNPNAPHTLCFAATGYVSSNTDCNDSDNQIHPGATERCNSIDDNCNNVIDDGFTPVTISASGATTFCASGNVSLTSSSTTNNLWSNGATTKTITVTTSGNYYVTNTVTLCTSNVITVTALSSIIITAGSATSFCNGDSVTLTSNFGAATQWSNGQIGSSIKVKTAGLITATGACSPFGTISSNTINILVTNPIALTGIYKSPSSGIACSSDNAYVGGSISQSPALSFSAANSRYAALGTWFNYSTFTLQMWIRPGSSQSSGARIIDNNSTASRSWTLMQNGTNTNSYILRINGVDQTTTAFTLDPLKWQHLTVVKTGFNISIYIDGVLLKTATSTVSTISYTGITPTLLVAVTPLLTNYWTGFIDELKIWNNARSATDIANDYLYINNNGTANLQAYYKLNEGTGSSLSDASGRGRTGTSFASWNFRAPTLSYSWTPAAAFINPTISATYINNAFLPTNLKLTVTDAITGCKVDSSTSFAIEQAPPKPTITITGDTTFCYGDSVILTTSALTGYLWSNAETTKSITVKASGSFATIERSTNGCQSLVTRYVPVKVNPYPLIPNISSSETSPVCSTDTLQLDASDYALSMDGNDGADLGNWFNYQEFSLQFWINPGSTQQDSAVILSNNFSTGKSWIIHQNEASTNANAYSFTVNASTPATINFTLTPNQWQLITIVKLASQIAVYKSNSSQYAYPIGAINYDGSQQLRLGKSTSGNKNWNGSIDELRIYNRVLTSTEITNSNNINIPISKSGLVAYYRMSENGGLTITDATSNHYDALLSGSPSWLSRNGTNAYIWNPSTHLSNPSIANPLVQNITAVTTYTVTVSDPASGCHVDSSITFAVNPTLAYYADADSDSFGNASDTIRACSQPSGYVTNNTDCDDNNALINQTTVWYTDADADHYGTGVSIIQCVRPVNGYLATELTSTTGDCNDNNNLIYPSAQRFEFTNSPGFINSIISPATGGSATLFRVEVDYFDLTNQHPGFGYPLLDLRRSSNQPERYYYMSEDDPSDLNTIDGKRFFVTFSGLPESDQWQAYVYTDRNNCITSTAIFNAPDVFRSANLEIFANDISFSNPHPNTNDNINVSAVVHNNSDFNAQNFVVHLKSQYDTLAIYPDVIVANLPAHSSTTVSWSITTPADPAWVPMEVKIDYTNVIGETNELDNRAIRPFINGNFNLPGGITVSSAVSPFASYSSVNNYPSISGSAQYFGTAIPLPDPGVAGATVTFTITETGANYTTYTNSNGNFSYAFPAPLLPGLYHITGSVTDYTLTGNFNSTFVILIPNCLPDLHPYINVSPATILQGNQVNGTITVTNNGCAATTFTTLLDVSQSDGTPLLNDIAIPALSPGQSFTSALPAITFNTVGAQSICAFADATNLVSEINENNGVCAYLNVLPLLPDIIPVEGPFYNFTACETSSFSVKLRNTGGVSTGNFTANVLVSKAGMSNISLSKTSINIPASSEVYVTFPFDYSVHGAGVYSYAVSCDVPLPNGVVVESNENNNTAVYSNTVSACIANLVLSDCNQLDVLPANLTYPGSLTLNATIVNNGNATASGPIPVTFHYSSGANYTVNYNGSISPGQSVLVSTSAPVPSHASTVLTATVDPSDIISESSENDNSESASMCWEFIPSVLCGNATNFWQRTYHLNQPANLYMAVLNNGLYHATNTKIRFEISGPGYNGFHNLGDAVIPFMSQTCYCPAVGSLNNAFAFTQNGTYTFRVTVDPDNEFTECNESNNVFIVDVTVNDRPDMRILSQYINPTLLNPDVGENISLDITYDNPGLSNVNDLMELKVLIDNIPLDSIKPVNGLPTDAHATYSIPTPWNSSIPGLHIIRAIIDSDNEIPESDELNNEATRAIIVGQSANLYFSEFSVSDSIPSLNQPVLFNTIVGNNGDLNCDADIQYYYVNDFGDTIFIRSQAIHVNANSSLTLPFLNWNVQDNSTVVIAKIINSNPVEYTYDDNIAQLNLGAFQLVIADTAETCEGAGNGSVTAVANGGVPPYVYFWNTGYAGQTLNAAAGNYTVTVFDNSGQSIVSNARINTKADIISPIIYNVPADIVYNVTNGICPPSINWITAQVSENCQLDTMFANHYPGENFQPGVTTVTYTAIDHSGNTSHASFNIRVNAFPLVFAGNDMEACSQVQLNAIYPAWGKGSWSTSSGISIFNPDSNETSANGLGYANNQFVWTVSNGSCGSLSDTLIVRDSCIPGILNLKLFIQGFYLGNGLMTSPLYNTSIVQNALEADTITIELHDALSPAMIISSQEVLLSTNGLTSIITPGRMAGKSFYIVIRHRNSVETWSKYPVSFDSTPVFFDYSR